MPSPAERPRACLRQRFAQQNQQILQNFDSWLDQTGAEAGSLRATGEAVTQAVANKAAMAKQGSGSKGGDNGKGQGKGHGKGHDN